MNYEDFSHCEHCGKNITGTGYSITEDSCYLCQECTKEILNIEQDKARGKE